MGELFCGDGVGLGWGRVDLCHRAAVSVCFKSRISSRSMSSRLLRAVAGFCSLSDSAQSRMSGLRCVSICCSGAYTMGGMGVLAPNGCTIVHS